MKKISIWIVIAIVLSAICVLGFDYKKATEPNYYYQVYLDGNLLGTIDSEKALAKYIDENGKYYKRKYNVNQIFAPNGLVVKKITTYSGETDSISDVYSKIKEAAPFTLEGYKMSIKKQVDTKDEEATEKLITTDVYVLKIKTFDEAIDTLINAYIGEENFNKYREGLQAEIETTGTIIENVYIGEDITVKEVKIPVDDKIYTDIDDLTKYLLYGENVSSDTYTVKAGDTIESVAFANKISEEELLLSNDTLTSKTNLLYPGQQLKIMATDPKISVTQETFVVRDVTSNFKTDERHDANAVIGVDKVIQQGEKGLERVSQRVKQVNGEIVYVDPKGKEVLKEPIDRVIVKGSKYVPSVGGSTWGWPVESGWTLSSPYSYRTNPVTGRRELHSGMDLSGTGYGSKVFASNNGVVMIAEYHWSYGNYVVINHNNGYMTLYAHLSKMQVKVGQTVAKGQVVGNVGMTGVASGPHLHFEVWKGSKYNHINPAALFPNGFG